MPKIIETQDKSALNFYGGNKEAFLSKDRFLILVGTANSGKTYCACWKMHLFAMKYPGVRILLTRKSLRALRDSAVVTYQNILRQSGMGDSVRVLGETRPTNFIYPKMERYENGKLYSGKSEIILAPLDTKGKALGAEYDMAYVNQPDTEGTTLEEFMLINSRCRLSNAPYRQIIADPNPAHDKHWLLTNSIQGGKEDGWKLYTSTHKDNPMLFDHELNEWTDLGNEQIKMLSELPGNLRESLYEGKWYNTAGMAFIDYWNPSKHIIYLESSEALSLGISAESKDGRIINAVPKEWPHYVSIDWGFGDPACALLIAKHPMKDLFIIHKHIYTTEMPIGPLADMINEMVREYNIQWVVADRGRAETSIVESVLRRKIITIDKGPGSVMDRMNIAINELSSNRWKFVSTRESLFNEPDPALVAKKKPMGCEEIPSLKKDDRTGMIDSRQPDHYYDAWTYFVRNYIMSSSGNIRNKEFIWL